MKKLSLPVENINRNSNGKSKKKLMETAKIRDETWKILVEINAVSDFVTIDCIDWVLEIKQVNQGHITLL